ncbi:MAG: hypothetical protein ACW99U_20610 [Candidatus Thorarchaeota archaeon]
MRNNPARLRDSFRDTTLPLNEALLDSDGAWYILHSTAGKSLLNESLEYGSSAFSYGPGQFILPRMKGLYAVHESDLDRARQFYDGPIYKVNLRSDFIDVFNATDSVTEAAIRAEEKSVEGFDLRLYYESLLDAIATTYTASEAQGMWGSIEETLLLMMGGGEGGIFDRSYYALLDSYPDLLETKGEWEGHIRTMLEEGYLPALAGAGAYREGGYNPKYSDVDMEIEWNTCPEEWFRRWEDGRFREDRTFEDFLRAQGTLPSEVVAYAWRQATPAAGVLYTADEIKGGPLNILVILNEDIIKSSRLVADEPRRLPESTDLVRISSQEAVLSYLDSLGASNTLRSQIRDLEDATRIDVPTAGKEIVSAYFDGKDLIAIAWATRASSLDRMESDEASVTFDMLIDPDFQSIGLGKQLLCDAISHLIEISKDSAESIDINVAVVSPILRRYLRTLGFKWVQPYSHLANTVEMKLALSDTDAIMAMCEDLTSISNI